MCMKTSLVERTPGAGRQANFSSGVASASASNWLDTWRHSPSYPCQSPSGGACASKGRALKNKRSTKSAFFMICLFLLFRFELRKTILYPERGWNWRRSCAARRRSHEKVGSVPVGERAAGEEGLGSPLAEVDGEGDAVAVVAGQDHHLFAARMASEDGEHFFGEEDRAAPAVGDAHVSKGRVQIADAAFEPAETAGSFAPADIVPAQIVRAIFDRARVQGKAGRRANVRRDKTGAKDDAVRFEQASPQIRKVHGVKRAARGQAEGFELRGGKRSGG